MAQIAMLAGLRGLGQTSVDLANGDWENEVFPYIKSNFTLHEVIAAHSRGEASSDGVDPVTGISTMYAQWAAGRMGAPLIDGGWSVKECPNPPFETSRPTFVGYYQDENNNVIGIECGTPEGDKIEREKKIEETKDKLAKHSFLTAFGIVSVLAAVVATVVVVKKRRARRG